MKKWTAPVVSMALLLAAAPAFAQDAAVDPNAYKGALAIGAGIAMGLAVLGGSLGQALGIKSALDGIARNPQASGKITIPMFAGLAFIESLIIFTFLVAFVGLTMKI